LHSASLALPSSSAWGARTKSAVPSASDSPCRLTANGQTWRRQSIRRRLLVVGSTRRGRRHSPSISWKRKFRLKWAVKGAPIARRKTGVLRRPMRAPPPAVETLDSPFQSEKGRFQEIDGKWRRPGSAVHPPPERQIREIGACHRI
jgi:hypothetical protein